MKEQNTNYAYKLKYLENPTFDKVRSCHQHRAADAWQRGCRDAVPAVPLRHAGMTKTPPSPKAGNVYKKSVKAGKSNEFFRNFAD